jgi:hypothetical protein
VRNIRTSFHRKSHVNSDDGDKEPLVTLQMAFGPQEVKHAEALDDESSEIAKYTKH